MFAIPGKGDYLSEVCARFGGKINVANLIWTILTILFIFWLIGLIAHIGGSLINLLIVIVVIGVIYNLVTGRRAV
jgi:uncharacterized protein DUF5670